MDIIIVGCGKVGQEITSRLSGDGNNITVIDIDESKSHETAEKYDVIAITGNGATHAVQQEAGIKNANLLIAVTGSDELNLLCCLIAKKAGNCQTIARVRNPDYSLEAPYLKEELGLAMVINPEAAAAAPRRYNPSMPGCPPKRTQIPPDPRSPDPQSPRQSRPVPPRQWMPHPWQPSAPNIP